jgi:hypothetical protein
MKVMRVLALSLGLSTSAACLAGLPADYNAIALDQAVTRAASDGKSVMVYFMITSR